MLVEGGKKYGVRLIPQTCNREDAIREIVGALDHLNAISDEIFSTIRTRLRSQKKDIEALSNRVSIAASQVSALKGSQKAIRIISPAKYPCEKEPANGPIPTVEQAAFPALVAKYIPDPVVLGHDVEECDKDKCKRPFRFDTPIKHPSDLLSIFHAREPNLGDLSQLDNVADIGLGRPPHTIRNMDSFFLFNTIDNPYVNYKMTDRSLQDRNFGTFKPTRKGEEVQADMCPTVAQEGDTENKVEADDFYYYPSASQIPDIDVPEFLPDLPGIAENLDLNDDFPSIFPGPPKSSSVINKTNFRDTGKPAQSLNFQPERVDAAFGIRTSTPEDVPMNFPDRPSPPSLNTSIIPTLTPPAPPPPPPPPPPPVVVDPPGPPSDAGPPTAMGGDLMSSLMAAIREAGGSGNARLKSAKDRKYEAKKKKQDEKEKNISNDLKEGGDLMADLKNKLAMRRKGISGIQDGSKRAGVGDIMLSLAAAIPTLDSSVEISTGPGGASDDDDWD